MTNEELIKAFFRGRCRGDEESYGFSVKPLLRECVGNFAFYSKISQFPMSIKVSNNLFIASTSSVGSNFGGWKKHVALVVKVAEQLDIILVHSPGANKARFHNYMERKINDDLISLAQKLEVNLSERFMPLACMSNVDFVYKYQKLIEHVRILLNGETQLNLPKNQITLVDTDEVQSLWRWLIKENPEKKDRELFLKMYTLSRLFNAQQRDVEIDLGTVDISSM